MPDIAQLLLEHRGLEFILTDRIRQLDGSILQQPIEIGLQRLLGSGFGENGAVHGANS